MAEVVLTTEIPPNRRLVLELPPETPIGPVEIVIRSVSEPIVAAIAAREVLASAMFGFWRDRDDIGDSAQYIWAGAA